MKGDKKAAPSGPLDASYALHEAYNVESACDLIAEAGGFQVIRFSEHRKTRLPGLPDRYFRHRTRQIRLFWECKSPTDRLTVAQAAFLNDELEANGLAGCGGPDDLLMVLGLCARLPHFGVIRRLKELVGVWCGKGYRDVRRPRVPRGTTSQRCAGGARRPRG